MGVNSSLGRVSFRHIGQVDTECFGPREIDDIVRIVFVKLSPATSAITQATRLAKTYRTSSPFLIPENVNNERLSSV